MGKAKIKLLEDNIKEHTPSLPLGTDQFFKLTKNFDLKTKD